MLENPEDVVYGLYILMKALDVKKGYIGIDTFNNIVSNEKLRNIPMYLETPNDMEGYAKEIAMLKQMYAKAH